MMRATALVTVTVEVAVPDGWGADCTVGQVDGQARTSALQMLTKAFPSSSILRIADITKVDIHIINEKERR